MNFILCLLKILYLSNQVNSSTNLFDNQRKLLTNDNEDNYQEFLEN